MSALIRLSCRISRADSYLTHSCWEQAKLAAADAKEAAGSKRKKRERGAAAEVEAAAAAPAPKKAALAAPMDAKCAIVDTTCVTALWSTICTWRDNV